MKEFKYVTKSKYLNKNRKKSKKNVEIKDR